jgi:5-methylcytosine-specific restriction protein B
VTDYHVEADEQTSLAVEPSLPAGTEGGGTANTSVAQSSLGDETSHGHTPPATATEWETRLSGAIAEAWGKGSGTVWGPTQAVLAEGTGFAPQDVGAISVTTEGVINNRPLSAGLITKPRKLLVIAVDAGVGLSRQREAVRKLIPLTRHLTTVALAEQVDGLWRVRQLIEVEDVGIASEVQHLFPLVPAIERVPLIPIGQVAPPVEAEELPPGDLPSYSEETDPPLDVPGGVAATVQRILDRLEAESVRLPNSQSVVRRCVLALARGHLILHGPPGTAKTTLGKILVKEFGCSRSLETATADWTTYDVIGGFRPGLGDDGREVLKVHHGCVTQAIFTCQKTIADNNLDRTTQQGHWLIIDEINRADIDKAIGGLYTVLGGGHSELPLWFAEDAETRTVTVPRRFRIVATMNDVDSGYANELSQGLSRRFTFVHLDVPTADQVRAEAEVAQRQAARRVLDNVPGILPEPWEATVNYFFEREDFRRATTAVSELVAWLRDGAPLTASGAEAEAGIGPVPAEVGEEETDIEGDDIAALAGWPLGTATVVDIYEQLLIAATATDDVADVVDEIAADTVIPQLAHMRRGDLQIRASQLRASRRWRACAEKAERLLDPSGRV